MAGAIAMAETPAAVSAHAVHNEIRRRVVIFRTALAGWDANNLRNSGTGAHGNAYENALLSGLKPAINNYRSLLTQPHHEQLSIPVIQIV
jgi:hypothetical protein